MGVEDQCMYPVDSEFGDVVTVWYLNFGLPWFVDILRYLWKTKFRGKLSR